MDILGSRFVYCSLTFTLTPRDLPGASVPPALHLCVSGGPGPRRSHASARGHSKIPSLPDWSKQSAMLSTT